MGVFSRHAEDYLAVGLAPFPVHTRLKRPAVKGWQKANCRRSEAWRRKFPTVDGLGLLMGASSRITEADVDAVGEAHIALAIERFGASPIVIQTASGKSKLWYRHDGEKRLIRPFNDVPMDLLGEGFSIAPPSWRSDLGAEYRFVSGSLEDVERLPTIRSNALGDRAADEVHRGERNNAIFLFAMREARHCDDVEALVDAARTWARAMAEPLPLREIERAARSAWGYETTGRNFLGLKRPQVSDDDRVQDRLRDVPEAYFLLRMFQRFHSNRPNFAIAPRAMSSRGSPPWDYRKIERARDVLVERNFLEIARLPQRGGPPGLYRLKLFPLRQGGRGV